MPKAAAKERRRAHLPEKPRQALGARGMQGRQKCTAKLLREIHQDRARLEDTDRLGAAAIQQRRDLRIRIDRDEAAAELLAVVDLYGPGVVLRRLVTECEQLLEHHRHLHAVGRGERVDLERMLAYG
jgi:hypothetical protein